MTIGKLLQELRKKKFIRQGVAAKGIGVSQTWLSLVEGDKRIPAIPMIQKCAKYYEVPEPVIQWLSISADTVPTNKKEAYTLIKPTMDAIIRDLFDIN